MAKVLLKSAETGNLKIDAFETYGVTKLEWINYYLNEGKSPTDRKGMVTVSNYSIVVMYPTAAGDDYYTTVIDTGVSTSQDPIFTKGITVPKNNQLAKSVALKQVDRVILSSLNHRRASNLIVHNTRGDAETVCPNAEFIMPKLEWDAVMGNEPFNTKAHREFFKDHYPGMKSSLEKLEFLHTPLRLVDEPEVDIGYGMSMEISGGVTVANATIYVSLGSERVMISPWLFPTPFHIMPEVQFGFGMNRFEAYEEKIRLLEKAERERLCILLPMDPQRRAFYIERDRYGNLVSVPCDILDQHRRED